ncbi:MAG: hypothetical protein ACM3O3_07815 [Syntrophothermus sp.]
MNNNDDKKELIERRYISKPSRSEIACLVDWNKDADSIKSLVTGVYFNNDINPIGTAKLKIDDDFYFIKEIIELPIISEVMPGSLKSVNNENIIISTKTNDVEIRRLFHLNGEEIKLSDLIVRHNLFAGKKFSTLSNRELNLLKYYEDIINKKEDYWVKELLNIELPELPYKKENIPTFNRYFTQSMSIPYQLKDSINLSGLSLKFTEYFSSLFILFFGRLTTSDYFTLGGFNCELKKELESAFNLFENEVPINIQLNLNNKLSNELIKVSSLIKIYQEAKTYYKDLPYRYPQLRSKKVIKYPLAIAIVNDIKDFDEIDGSDLTLIFTKNNLCYWHYCSSIYSEENIKILQKQFRIFLDEALIDPYKKLYKYNINQEEEVKSFAEIVNEE